MSSASKHSRVLSLRKVEGGLTSVESLTLLRSLRGVSLMGADAVEVAPPFDPAGSTSLLAATIMYELLCLLAESRT